MTEKTPCTLVLYRDGTCEIEDHEFRMATSLEGPIIERQIVEIRPGD